MTDADQPDANRSGQRYAEKDHRLLPRSKSEGEADQRREGGRRQPQDDKIFKKRLAEDAAEQNQQPENRHKVQQMREHNPLPLPFLSV